MSSIKLEVHNILHFRQRRTEPRPKVTCIKDLDVVVVFQTCKQTDKQTDIYADTMTTKLCTSTRGKVADTTLVHSLPIPQIL